jgi:hypothetical protein
MKRRGGFRGICSTFENRRTASVETNDERGTMNDEVKSNCSPVHHSSFRVHRFLCPFSGS